MTSPALVSIVIPAYNPRYFDAALRTALAQSYAALEVVVCDDSEGDSIQLSVQAIEQQMGRPVRYLRNRKRLGFAGNVCEAVAQARGEFVKVLCDDDRLLPDCIVMQARAMVLNPDVELVTCQRQYCDANDHLLPARLSNCVITPKGSVLMGVDILSIIERSPINVYGGFSSTLMRTAQAQALLPVLCDNGFGGLLDLALYCCLFRRGQLATINHVLCFERMHDGRFSEAASVIAARDDEVRWLDDMLRQRGGEQPPADGWVRIRPLTDGALQEPIEWDEHAMMRILMAQQTHLLGRVGSFSSSFEEVLAQWLQCRTLTPAAKALIPRRLASWPRQPRLAVLLLDHGQHALDVTLASLAGQSYAASEVVVLSARQQADHRAIDGVRYLPMQADPWAQARALVDTLEADWVYLLRDGDRLLDDTLLILAERIAVRPALVCLYGDEGVVRGGISQEPVFRPDFNLDLMRAYPYVGRLLAFDLAALRGVGGLAAELGELAPHDALWRLVEQRGPGAIGHVPELLVESRYSFAQWLGEPAVAEGSVALLQAHLGRLGVAGEVERDGEHALCRVRYGHAQQAGVSIIILCGAEPEVVQRCVDNLFAKTDWPAFEVLLVADQPDEATVRWLSGIEGLGSDRLRVVDARAAAGHAPSARNLAAAAARGELLLFLDRRALVFEPGWLAAMANHGQRPEVAVVGAKMLRPDGRVSRAGQVLGLNGPANSPFTNETFNAKGYMQRLQATQNWSAVALESLMVDRQAFQEVGGFDEQHFGEHFSETDLCLRLGRAGYLVVWTAEARLGLDLLPSTVTNEQDEEQLYRRWLPAIARDPAYNPNLAVFNVAFSMEPGEITGWDPFVEPVLPTVVALPVDRSAVGHYRVVQPFTELEKAGWVQGRLIDGMPSMVGLERLDPQVIVLQCRYSKGTVEQMEQLSKYSHAKRVYELDDYVVNVPTKNAHGRNLPSDMEAIVRRGIGLCDRVVVSTQPLAEKLAHMHNDIRVVPNMLAPHLWSTQRAQRNTSRKPRVGWGGGTSHRGDLELIADVVRLLADEVDWVFFGMCPEALRPYVREFHPVVPLNLYPSKLSSLNLDLALAPLELHEFNDCKSNLRLLEYGACGFPVICSDTKAYRGYLPATRVETNSTEEWMAAIRKHLDDPAFNQARGDALHDVVMRDYVLRGENLRHWFNGWFAD